jgi:glycosyltransferase involved in cell wall biosynthesis
MITVLFATYNGSHTLDAVLKAYCGLIMPDNEWKLVIVDNGSTDSTRSIIRRYMDDLPLTLMGESKQGKNAALNTGLSEVEGDLVVLTDDDALPQPDWLYHLRNACDSQPSYAIFGGRILPKWEMPPEEWLLAVVPLGPTFAILDHIPEDGPVEHYKVYGPNMAIRSQVFESGFRFDESIGPKGKNYPQGSETQLLLRLRDAGYSAWHCKNAVVQHIIKPSQMNQEWILRRAIRYGRGQYRLGAHAFMRGASFMGIPYWQMLRILKRIFITAKAKMGKDKEKLFKLRWELNFEVGRAIEAHYSFRAAPRQ